jgi:hypothetical protein
MKKEEAWTSSNREEERNYSYLKISSRIMHHNLQRIHCGYSGLCLMNEGEIQCVVESVISVRNLHQCCKMLLPATILCGKGSFHLKKNSFYAN